MLLVACSNAFCQDNLPDLPKAASCFPSITINRLSSIQIKIIGLNQQLASATTHDSKILSITEFLKTVKEVSALYDSVVVGIENSENKVLSLKHKANADEQLTEASNQISALSATDSTTENTLPASLHKIVISLDEIDSAFVTINPCPIKGKEEYYTDNNGRRQINLSMVNRFKQIWNEANTPLTYDNYTYQSKERDLFKWRNIAQLWTDYRFGQDVKQDTAVGPNTANQLAENQQVTSSTEKDKGNYRTGELRSGSGRDGGNRDGKIKNLPFEKSASNSRSTADSTNRLKRENSGPTKDGSKSTISESDKKIAAYASGELTADFFTVQIAANTKPLDTKLLMALYKGQFTIEERLEDGWYRYVVGRFFDVNSAISHLNTSIEVGMVTAYKGNSRTIVKTKIRPDQALSTQEGLIAVYRVQIAAAKKPIQAKDLKALYAGIRPINVYAEDGWFRYSIGDYLLYSDAISVRDSSGVHGAFVMPYINGVRQSIKGKLDVQREEAKRSTNPVFVVQLAATKRPISLGKLKIYRKSGIPVTLRIEDGWYKYTSNVFFNKDLARKKAQEMKVSGAFIVTYMNGKRINP